MNQRTFLSILGIFILLLLAARILNQPKSNTPSHKNTTNQSRPSATANDPGIHNASGLNRHPRRIHYSKHARCRMDCRRISESEVEEILAKGQINYRKSQLDAPSCQKRYAVEGTTHDQQHVRIIFAPCDDEETVVTVIDLGREWSCDCR